MIYIELFSEWSLKERIVILFRIVILICDIIDYKLRWIRRDEGGHNKLVNGWVIK